MASNGNATHCAPVWIQHEFRDVNKTFSCFNGYTVAKKGERSPALYEVVYAESMVYIFQLPSMIWHKLCVIMHRVAHRGQCSVPKFCVSFSMKSLGDPSNDVCLLFVEFSRKKNPLHEKLSTWVVSFW